MELSRKKELNKLTPKLSQNQSPNNTSKIVVPGENIMADNSSSRGRSFI